MNIVHFSNNSLAGAPIRLVRALGSLPGISARLVDTRRFGLYDHDVVFAETPELARDLARDADILHLHNFLDERSTDFAPLDFAALARRGVPILRHFHSIPELVAARMGRTVSEVLDSPLPSVVIAQYPERFYPRARVVPNLVPQDDPRYRPVADPPHHDLFFAPTKPSGAFENRWNTKGTPETLAILDRVARRTGCRVNARDGNQLAPLDRILSEKARSRVVLDDMVNGSYHLSGLEGLSLGRTVCNYLDARNLALLREFAGSDHCPFVNIRLEEAEAVLTYLVGHPDEADALGHDGRAWVEAHWRDTDLAGHYLAVYRDLLRDPALVTRQAPLRLDGVRRFFCLTMPDLVYETRKAAWARTQGNNDAVS